MRGGHVSRRLRKEYRDKGEKENRTKENMWERPMLEIVAVRDVRLSENFGSDIFVGYFLRVRNGATAISDIRTPLRSSNTFK